MSANVQPEGTREQGWDRDQDRDQAAAPPPPQTPLHALKQRVEQARAENHLDRSPPGIPELLVRYRPLSPDESVEIERQARKDAQRAGEPFGLWQALHVLARCCTGIYERGPGGTLQVDGALLASPDGVTPVTFATLNLAQTGYATDEVRALFAASEGHVIGTAGDIVRWSGLVSGEMGEATLGN